MQKRFYAEAYELAKQIAGGEQYVISAVMHADERNREASDRLGKGCVPLPYACYLSSGGGKGDPVVKALQGPHTAWDRSGNGHAGKP